TTLNYTLSLHDALPIYHLIPRPNPDKADSVNKIVTAIIIKNCTMKPSGILEFKYDSPPLIWMAPSPSDVATPNTVAKTAITSTVFPIGPCIRSPISGWNVVLIVPGIPFLNWKNANVNPINV